MNAPRDIDPLISSYLEDGVDELPDRAFDAVRSDIEHTRQRFVFGPWREEQMQRYAIFGIAAAAIVLVAVVAIQFLPGNALIGGPPTSTPSLAPTLSPPPTSSLPPAPTLAPTAAIALPNGALAPGSYFIDDPAVIGVHRMIFTVPAGWANKDPFVSKNAGTPGEVDFTPWVVTDVYRDVCHWSNSSLFIVDSGPDALIRALRDQGGREEAQGGWPWTGTVAGYPAEGIALTVPADTKTADCSGGILRYWPDPGPDFTGGLCCNVPGNTDFVYAVDVAGKTVAVVARHYDATTPGDLAELDAVINSIHFEP
jgi:hypothetical protein